jgi:O-antigen/teichoic acid export membrane protein
MVFLTGYVNTFASRFIKFVNQKVNNFIKNIIEKNTTFFQNLKNTGLYFGASIVQVIIAFFTTPVFSKYLSASDFGIIGYFTSIQSLLTIFFTLSTVNFFILKYYENDSEPGKILFNIFFIHTCINVFFALISYWIIKAVFEYFNISFPFHPYTEIIIATVMLSPYALFLQILYRVEKKAVHFFAFRSAIAILSVLFSLFFIIYLELGPKGKMLGLLVTSILTTFLSFFLLRRFMIYKFDLTIIVKILQHSIPLAMAAIAYYPIINLDKLYLERLTNSEEYGLYIIGASISSYLIVLGYSIYQAFEPDIFKLTIQENYKKLRQYLLILSIGMLIVHSIFILSSKPLINILTAGKFTEAYKYANLLAIANYLLFLFSLSSAILNALKKTKLIFFINFTVGSLSLFVVPRFIAKMQYLGAGLSQIFLFALLFILSTSVVVFNLTIQRKETI